MIQNRNKKETKGKNVTMTNKKELLDKILQYVEDNSVTYDMGETWVISLEDGEKSDGIIPFLKELLK